MRIRNTIRNSSYSIVSACVSVVLTFALRKVFLDVLPVELLGYEGLFGSLFSILSLANLGIQSLILYRLFPAFAKKDRIMIGHLMSIYRVLYRYIGIAILFIGICLIPFLKIIVSDEVINWTYVYIIYSISLLGTLCTYFISYKRILFQVSQEEFECTKIDIVIGVICNLVKIFILLTTKSYILYLSCGLIGTVLGNIIILKKVKHKFSDIQFTEKITWQDIRSLKMISEVKNNFVQQICFVIYGGTDNILITILFGIGKTGLLANYSLIQSHITGFLTKLLNPFQMSIGNYIYSSDVDEGEKLFRMFDFISYGVACIVSICYIVLFNPTISFFFGKEYLLPFSFVVGFAVNQYISWNHQFLTYYRQSFGKYELDTVPIVIAAILNILISVFLGKAIGITGVIIGTAIGHLGIWIGRVKVVYHEYMHEKVSKYVYRQIIRLGCYIIQNILAYSICKNMPLTIWGLIERLVICILLSIAVNYLAFYRTQEIRMVCRYLKKTIAEIF